MELALTILAISGFVGSMPQFWGSSWKNIIQYYYGGTLPWESVHKSALRIIDKLEKESFPPSVIMGIGRGGILGAGLICSELTRRYLSNTHQFRQNDLFPNIKIEAINSKVIFKPERLEKTSNGNLSPRIERIEFANDDLNVEINDADKLLLLVAQNFTGGSLEKALISFLDKDIKRENVRTASLFWHKDKKIKCSHEPDVFGEIISVSKTMPWKIKENSTDRY